MVITNTTKKISYEHTKRVNFLCRPNLNGGSLITGVIPWAIVSYILCKFSEIEWAIEELVNMDMKISKVMAIHDYHHVRSNVARLYSTRLRYRRGSIARDNYYVKWVKSLFKK